MKVLFDTSILVAALVRAHPRHGTCRPLLERIVAGEDDLELSAHSLLELYSVLTTLPVKPRISPETARKLIEENGLKPGGLASVHSLQAGEYVELVEGCAQRELAGGVVYDALIARIAENRSVEALWTLNPEHFRRVWPEGADRIRTP